jgi:hypothetical protein
VINEECLITCQCGHSAGFDDFTISPSGVNLKHGHWQCRSCGFAWTIRPKGKARMTPSGFVILPDREIVEVPKVA